MASISRVPGAQGYFEVRVKLVTVSVPSLCGVLVDSALSWTQYVDVVTVPEVSVTVTEFPDTAYVPDPTLETVRSTLHEQDVDTDPEHEMVTGTVNCPFSASATAEQSE